MCSHVHVDDLQSVYNLSSEIRDRLRINGTSIAEIVKSLGTFDGHYFSNSSWLDGMNTVPWIACVNESGQQPALEVQVNFVGVGKASLPSYANISRPFVASVRLIAYKSMSELLAGDMMESATRLANNKTNITEILSHHWLTVVLLERAGEAKRLELLRPRRGLFCSGMAPTRLPNDLPLKFETQIEYSDDQRTYKDAAKVRFATPHVFNRLFSSCTTVATELSHLRSILTPTQTFRSYKTQMPPLLSSAAH